MAVLSALRVAQRSCNNNFLSKWKPTLTCHVFPVGSVRFMGSHKRMMYITPSRFQWHKFKDALHFYTLLGVIPLTILVFGVNIFIGPAELAEIADGYEPEPYEYYKHPIQRWFANYIYPTHQQQYEKYLHSLKEEMEKRDLRLLEKKVKALMQERGDYQSWYYKPITAKYVRQHRAISDEARELYGEKVD